MDIMIAVLVLGGFGLLFGAILAVASKIFVVAVDPLIEEIREALPGANCGACGFPGCDGLAAAIANGTAESTACIVGGAPVAEKVAALVGSSGEALEKTVATVLCQGNCDKAKDRFIYNGIKDCRVEAILHGGSKACSYGCLGCGTCVEACKFDSIYVVGGVAIVDKEKCVACGKCVEVCPKKIIEITPYKAEYHVRCKSNDSGKDVRGNCSIGCIGCQICVKNCPESCIGFSDNLARIDYEKCVNCGMCASKCPTNAIPKINKPEKEAI